MELGLTFPLQRFLHTEPLPYGVDLQRGFCWDLHVITLGGKKSLLAVHCLSRYTFVRYAPTWGEWRDPGRLFRLGLEESLEDAGLKREQVQNYLARAGEVIFSRTHGRREVAFLNRAWEDVLSMEHCLDREASAQPLLDRAVNTLPCRCAGLPGLDCAQNRISAAFLAADGRRMTV